jgi:hypothetical protein
MTQGVVGNVLVLESFGAAFPHIYMNAGLKVSTNLLNCANVADFRLRDGTFRRCC